MGLLPEIAAGVGVDIPAAGHTISAYAAGVVIGAPLLAVLAATWPRKALLIGLMVAFTAGNVLERRRPHLRDPRRARLLAGLPHGAFFGVAALVAVDLAARGQAGRAVGRVMLGIPIANVLGVPARRGSARASAGARPTGSSRSSASRPSASSRMPCRTSPPTAAAPCAAS